MNFILPYITYYIRIQVSKTGLNFEKYIKCDKKGRSEKRLIYSLNEEKNIIICCFTFAVSGKTQRFLAPN